MDIMDGVILGALAVVMVQYFRLSMKLEAVKSVLRQMGPAIEDFSRSVDKSERAVASFRKRAREASRDVKDEDLNPSDPMSFYKIARQGSRA